MSSNAGPHTTQDKNPVNNPSKSPDKSPSTNPPESPISSPVMSPITSPASAGTSAGMKEESGLGMACRSCHQASVRAADRSFKVTSEER